MLTGRTTEKTTCWNDKSADYGYRISLGMISEGSTNNAFELPKEIQ